MPEVLLALIPIILIGMLCFGISKLPEKPRHIAILGLVATMAACILGLATGQSLDPIITWGQTTAGTLVLVGIVLIFCILILYVSKLKKAATSEKKYWETQEEASIESLKSQISTAQIQNLPTKSLTAVVKLLWAAKGWSPNQVRLGGFSAQNADGLRCHVTIKSGEKPSGAGTIRALDKEPEQFIISQAGFSTFAKELADENNIACLASEDIAQQINGLAPEKQAEILNELSQR